ncbi:putative mitochondrial carrier domain superfamily [Helianthus debilis subsp. tardiflorus]
MGVEKPKPIGGVWLTIKTFVNGGASGMLATCAIQPIDMIKVFTEHGVEKRCSSYKTVLHERLDE